MVINLPFNRTTCDCQECVACCKRQPGPLIPGDYERITAFLGEDAKKYLVNSRGASVLDVRTNKILRVGTITPRFDKETQRCVFLDDQDRCRIHAVAPAGCAYFDTHMDGYEGQKRGLLLIRLQQDPEYQRLRSELPLSDHYKPTGY